MPAPYRPSTGAEAAQRWTAIDRRPGQQRALVRVRARGRAGPVIIEPRNQRVLGISKLRGPAFLLKKNLAWQLSVCVSVCVCVSLTAPPSLLPAAAPPSV